MTGAVIDAYENIERVTEESKKEMLADFDQQLSDLILLHFNADNHRAKAGIASKHRLYGLIAVIEELKPTLSEIQALPQYQRLAKLCAEYGCDLTCEPKELSLINEGFVHVDFCLTISRP